MDTNLLSAFTAVVDANSFEMAAEKMYLSKSAISLRIQRLKELVGAELFYQKRNGVFLTPIGQEIYTLAKEILFLEEKLMSLRVENSDSIKAGAGEQMMVSVILPAINRIKAKNPGTDFSLYVADSQKLFHMLTVGALDLILSWKEFEGDNINKVMLCKTTLYVVLNKRHPLAAATSLTVRDVLQYPLVLRPVGTLSREILERHVATQSCPPNIFLEVSNNEAILNVVRSQKADTNVIGGFTTHDVDRFLNTISTDELVVCPIKDVVRNPIYIYSLKNNLNPNLSSFINYLLKGQEAKGSGD